MSPPFRVGLTRDLLAADGAPGTFAQGLDALDRTPGVATMYLAGDAPELGADQVRGIDALVVLSARVTAASLAGADRLTLLARLGVGYDAVDVPACTRHGVLLTITPDGVRRPMATVQLAFVLALGLRLLEKDRRTRAGDGWTRRDEYIGTGLTGCTLGSIGLGNIGREFFALAQPLGMRHLAHDPYVAAADAAALGVTLVDLETLLRESDFVVVNTTLTPETRHLLNADRLALMKPTAFLINAARGPIVDQQALTEILRGRRLAGAAMDVFEEEPIDPADPILALDNVIVTPHALCWTDEWALLSGCSAANAIFDVRAGRVPPHVVNREVLDTPRFHERLDRYAREAAR